ncbi:MAG TPA: hypothetical protein DF774_16380 [Rheinheimera sp.]|uniref:hypothetical protein n=1 Tax=Rheinheimera sp. TaxID=1869214 RepID=UPI000ED470DE|nr:hypothetical protein [Rheinheimera sp.]HCU67327.1 hypothetical protein [Rheinheimera sp.]
MPKLLQNILSLLAGVVVGSAVNMALIQLGPLLIAPPAGVDLHNAESLKQGISLFEPQHFVTPWLAHALGTFAGAWVACYLAASYKIQLAFVVALLFFCGGVAASIMIPAPGWFIALDLLLAYLPMAWLAGKLHQSPGR